MAPGLAGRWQRQISFFGIARQHHERQGDYAVRGASAGSRVGEGGIALVKSVVCALLCVTCRLLLVVERLVFCWRSIVPSKCLLSFRVQYFILSVPEPVGKAGDRVSTLEELVRLD